MTILEYLSEKDDFRIFYWTKLSNRLLYNVSASDKAEANMVSKLKEPCGFEYTNKLQRMLAGRLLPLLRMRRSLTIL
jgi:cullin 1